MWIKFIRDKLIAHIWCGIEIISTRYKTVMSWFVRKNILKIHFPITLSFFTRHTIRNDGKFICRHIQRDRGESKGRGGYRRVIKINVA